LPESVQVTIEVDAQMNRVRATALGSTELKARDLRKEVGEAEAKSITAEAMQADAATLRRLAGTATMWVFEGRTESREWGIFTRKRKPVRVVDHQGIVKLQRESALVVQTTVAKWPETFARLWQEGTVYVGDATVYPDMFLMVGSRLADLSGMQAETHAVEVARTELAGRPGDEIVVILAGLRETG
jgi:N-methylhydantoinase A